MRTTALLTAILVLLVSGTVSAMTAEEMSAMVPDELKANPPDGTVWDEELGVFVFDPPIPIELPQSMLLNGDADMLFYDDELLMIAVYNYYGEYSALTKFTLPETPCDNGHWEVSSVLIGCFNSPLVGGQTPDPLEVIVYEHNALCPKTAENPRGEGTGAELGRQYYEPIPYMWDMSPMQIVKWQQVVFEYPVAVEGPHFWVRWLHLPNDLYNPVSHYVFGGYRDGSTYNDYLRFFENPVPCPTIVVGYGPWMIRVLGHCVEEPVVDGKIDIKPTSCPNPINPQDLGVVSVAILGTHVPEVFDVTSVDPTTVALMGVQPIRWAYEDVATPYNYELCGCHTDGPDGIEDLVFKFDTRAVFGSIETAFGPVADNDSITVVMTWKLLDGTLMQGSDCFLTRLNKHYLPFDDGNGLDSYAGETGAIGDGDGLQSAAWHSGARGFSLFQNAPNPFRTRTAISFSLKENARTRLTVHDASGRLVATLVDADLESGTYSVEWSTDVPSGIYFCRMQAGEYNSAIRLACLR